MYSYLKGHFHSLAKGQMDRTQVKKSTSDKRQKLNTPHDISSLPESDSDSQNLMLKFDKYEDNKLPKGLSSLNDISLPGTTKFDMENVNESLVKTPIHVKELLGNGNHSNTKKLELITQEIYKAAQLMGSEGGNEKQQAEYISSCALKIMSLVNHQNKNEKSLDTLQMIHDEKEIENRLGGESQSFLTESDHMFDEIEPNSGTKLQNFDTVIVRNNVRDRLNLKNLQRQFVWDQLAGVTPRDQFEDPANLKQEIKTTAATSKRRLEEEKEEPLNIKVSNQVKNKGFHIPQKKNLSVSSSEEIKTNKVEKNQKTERETSPPFDYEQLMNDRGQSEVREKIVIQPQILKPQEQRHISSYSKPRSIRENPVVQSAVINSSINMLRNETYQWTTDLFRGFMDYFLPDDSSEDDVGSIGSWFGCSKKQKRQRAKVITPQSQKIRATSQLRIGQKYFNVSQSLTRSKSKEFLNNQVIEHVMKQDSNNYGNQGSSLSHNVTHTNFKKEKLDAMNPSKRPESSNDINTNHSSKPHSKLQSDQKQTTRRRKPSDSQLPVPKVIKANMSNLNWVKEEPESNQGHADKHESNAIENFELKQLENKSEAKMSRHNSMSTNVLKNNFLMNTGPIGSFKVLEIENVEGSADFKRELPRTYIRSKTARNAEKITEAKATSGNFHMKREDIIPEVERESKKSTRRHTRNMSNELKWNQQKMADKKLARQYNKDGNSDINNSLRKDNSNKIGDYFEITPSGMVKIAKTISKKNEDRSYMKAKIKENNKAIEL